MGLTGDDLKAPAHTKGWYLLVDFFVLVPNLALTKNEVDGRDYTIKAGLRFLSIVVP